MSPKERKEQVWETQSGCNTSQLLPKGLEVYLLTTCVWSSLTTCADPENVAWGSRSLVALGLSILGASLLLEEGWSRPACWIGHKWPIIFLFQVNQMCV
jgi:hypothetical protein